METTVKSNQASSSMKVEKTHTSTSTTMSPFWESMEFNRYGIIAMLVVIIGCVGGFAAGFGAKDDAIKIGMLAFPTAVSLALILAVAPMRTIIFTTAIAVVLDIIILIF